MLFISYIYSDYESEYNSSAYISVFQQRTYIKIEMIHGKTVPQIHAALNEVCVIPQIFGRDNWNNITRAKKIRR